MQNKEKEDGLLLRYIKSNYKDPLAYFTFVIIASMFFGIIMLGTSCQASISLLP